MRIEESVTLHVTLDRYTEVMQGVVCDLKAAIKELQASREAVNAKFDELASFFGERPAGVKEQEWWRLVIKFVKAAGQLQAAVLKEREVAAAMEERKAKRAAKGQGVLDGKQ